MSWTFLTNHAHVLLCLSRDPDVRLRDLAVLVGITERAVARILGELVDDGYVDVVKEGRRNHYQVNASRPLRHPVEEGVAVGDLVALIGR
jgi:predicted ArsR family transcriptional regulator